MVFCHPRGYNYYITCFEEKKMSTPKKIRATYEITFRKLVSTSPASKRFRQFLSSLRSPVQAFNLPITLADVRPQMFSPLKTVKKPTMRKPTKTAKLAKPAKAVKTTKKAKAKTTVKKTTARRKTSKK